jgi:hypothetical protein
MDSKDLVSMLGTRFTLLLHAITQGKYFSYRNNFDILPYSGDVYGPYFLRKKRKTGFICS